MYLKVNSTEKIWFKKHIFLEKWPYLAIFSNDWLSRFVYLSSVFLYYKALTSICKANDFVRFLYRINICLVHIKFTPAQVLCPWPTALVLLLLLLRLPVLLLLSPPILSPAIFPVTQVHVQVKLTATRDAIVYLQKELACGWSVIHQVRMGSMVKAHNVQNIVWNLPYILFTKSLLKDCVTFSIIQIQTAWSFRTSWYAYQQKSQMRCHHCQ